MASILSIKSFVFVCIFLSLLLLKWRSKTNKILISILLVLLITETLAFILVGYDISINLMYSLSFILHQWLWLLLITATNQAKKMGIAFQVSFILFSLTNLLFWEGCSSLNYYTFIFGSFAYIFLFIYNSFKQMNKEDLAYFTSNDFLLLFAPVLFFFGFSFLFAFKNSKLYSIEIIHKVELYEAISYFVNFIYYSHLVIYSFNTRKLKNA